MLVCGWLAASPCPPPTLPPFRQVSWLPTIPTVAPYHLSDIHCPGREQGASACTWCLARVPLLALEAHFLLTQHRKDLPGFWETQVLGKHRHILYLWSGTGSFKVISCFLTRKNWVIFFFFFGILQPEFIVKAEIYRIHWKEEAWRSLRADLGLTAWPQVLGTL